MERRSFPIIGMLIGCVVLLFVSAPGPVIGDDTRRPGDADGTRNGIDMLDDLYQSLLDDAMAAGLPGVIMLADTPERGMWMGASGM